MSQRALVTIWYAYFNLSSASVQVSLFQTSSTIDDNTCICSLGQTHEYTIEYYCTNVFSDRQSSSWVLTFDPNFLKCDINAHKSSYGTSSPRLVPSSASPGFSNNDFFSIFVKLAHIAVRIWLSTKTFFLPCCSLTPSSFCGSCQKLPSRVLKKVF